MTSCTAMLSGFQSSYISASYMANEQDKAVQPGDHLAAAEMSVEGNYNQIDGIINNEAPKPSLLDNLRQCQEEAGKSQGGTAPPSPSRDPER